VGVRWGERWWWKARVRVRVRVLLVDVDAVTLGICLRSHRLSFTIVNVDRAMEVRLMKFPDST